MYSSGVRPLAAISASRLAVALFGVPFFRPPVLGLPSVQVVDVRGTASSLPLFYWPLMSLLLSRPCHRCHHHLEANRPSSQHHTTYTLIPSAERPDSARSHNENHNGHPHDATTTGLDLMHRSPCSHWPRRTRHSAPDKHPCWPPTIPRNLAFRYLFAT